MLGGFVVGVLRVLYVECVCGVLVLVVLVFCGVARIGFYTYLLLLLHVISAF